MHENFTSGFWERHSEVMDNPQWIGLLISPHESTNAASNPAHMYLSSNRFGKLDEFLPLNFITNIRHGVARGVCSTGNVRPEVYSGERVISTSQSSSYPDPVWGRTIFTNLHVWGNFMEFLGCGDRVGPDITKRLYTFIMPKMPCYWQNLASFLAKSWAQIP